MDALDVHRGRMSWRKLRVYLQHLPPESATMTAIRNALPEDERERLAEESEPERGRWSAAEQLLAGIADAVRRLEYLTVLVNSDSKGRKPDPPEPIRRPGVGRKKRGGAKPLDEAGADRLFRLIHGGAEGA